MTIRLLIADDHRMMREGLCKLLEAQSEFEVIGEAEDGREAVAQTRALNPDIVIMDLGMKELNGVEATRQIRDEFPRVEVVVLSTYASESYVLKALEAGASAYVLKISAHQELVAAIQSVAKGHRFLSPEITGIVVDAGIQVARTAERPLGGDLTACEREVLQLVAEGCSSGEIGARLYLSTRTIEQHRQHIMEKLDLHGVAELTKYALRHGLVSLDE